MQIDVVGLPKERTISLEEFVASTDWGKTAFAKLLQALVAETWTKDLTAYVSISDEGGVYFSLKHPLFVSEDGSNSVKILCTLEHVPNVTGVAKLVHDAHKQTWGHLTAVKLTLESQRSYVEFAKRKLIESLGRGAIENATKSQFSEVHVGQYAVACPVGDSESFVVKVVDLWNDTPQVYHVTGRPYIVANEWSSDRLEGAIRNGRRIS